MTGVTAAISDRRISQSTCQRYGVTVEYGTDGQIVKHHYPYHHKDTGAVTGTKVRITENKSFYATGEFNEAGLFGQQAFKTGGKYITITEGEADALPGGRRHRRELPPRRRRLRRLSAGGRAQRLGRALLCATVRLDS